MDNFSFFNFELDTKVPSDAIKVGHAVNANIYKIDELATIAGPADGGHYTVGQIRTSFTQRWNIASGAAAFLRKAGGQSVEVNDSTVVEPGDELEFRAKDGEKGGLIDLGLAELRKLAMALGLSGKGKKADLAREIIEITVREAEGTTFPPDKNKVVTARVYKARYTPLRYDRGSANKLSISELAKKYPLGVIERGKVVEYIDEPSGETLFVAEYQSEKFVGQRAGNIAAGVAVGGKVLSASKKEDEILSAGETLQIIIK